MKVIPTLTIGNKKWYKEKFLLYDALNISSMRINLTRYSLNYYLKQLLLIKEIQHELWGYEKIEILLDVPYPGTKARICFDGEESNYYIKKNEKIFIVKDKNKMNIKQKKFWVDLFEHLKTGNINEKVEIDDGKLSFNILEKNDEYIKLESMSNGYIGYMKSINLVGQVYINQDSPKIKKDLKNIIEKTQPNKVIFSFLNDLNQIIDIKEYFNLDEKKIIPKIETPIAINNLDKIATECKTLMLGRGDLVLTSNSSMLGIYQDTFINICKEKNKSIIIATDIMNSNLDNNNKLPLRSDLIDLDNLIKSKVDYVVTSGKMGMSKKLNQMVKLINEISKERFE